MQETKVHKNVEEHEDDSHRVDDCDDNPNDDSRDGVQVEGLGECDHETCADDAEEGEDNR